jgi:tetratricopeptide (TPR) repeat protein
LKQAAIQQDIPSRLWLTSHLGWHLSEQGRVSEAFEQLRQVETEILTLGQTDLLKETEVLNHLGQVYLRQGDLIQAKTYQSRFLDLAEKASDRHCALVARYYLAWIQSREGKIDEAEQQYTALVTEAQEIGWERAEGYCAYRLALVLIHLDRLDEAEYWLNHTSEMADHWQEPFLQAHVLFGRAQLQGKHEETAEVCSLAQSALDLYRRLGAGSDIKRVTAFLAGLDASSYP